MTNFKSWKYKFKNLTIVNNLISTNYNAYFAITFIFPLFPNVHTTHKYFKFSLKAFYFFVFIAWGYVLCLDLSRFSSISDSVIS